MPHAHVFVPVFPDNFVDMELTDGRSVRQYLNNTGFELDEWSPCIRVVDVLADLLKNGLWQWLVGLMRWAPLMAWMPDEWPHKPPEHEGEADLSQFRMTPQRLKLLAHQVSSWAPSVLAAPNGEDTP